MWRLEAKGELHWVEEASFVQQSFASIPSDVYHKDDTRYCSFSQRRWEKSKPCVGSSLQGFITYKNWNFTLRYIITQNILYAYEQAKQSNTCVNYFKM
jgi:hypothetical protein